MNRMIHFTNKKFLLCIILYGMFSFSLLSPIGTPLETRSPYIPDNDYIAHSMLIVQAKMALDEGQFPIRVAPWEHQGLRYPEYQFYGALPFTVAGYLYRYFSHFHSVMLNNPFNTLKLVLWMTLTLSGIYAHRFARLFTQSDVIAILAAAAYMFSPYLILNVNWRGDFTETVALGILPATVYYGFKIILSSQFRMTDCIFSAIAWLALLITHLITFAYASIFFLLSMSILLIFRSVTFKRFLCVLCSYGYGCILGAWYIVPLVLLSSYIAAGAGFNRGDGGGIGLKPTSITNLLALHSAGAFSPSWPGFYTAIGWIYLFGFISCIYSLPKPKIYTHNYKLMLTITFLFALAIFVAWSQINIWGFLPHYFAIGQFGYRFLAQMMWLGIILIVLAIETIFGNQLDARHLVIGIFLICFAGSSWLVNPPQGVKVDSLMNSPGIYSGDYLIRPDTLPPFPHLNEYGFVQLPLIRDKSKLVLDRSVKIPNSLVSRGISLLLQGTIAHDAEPGILQIKLNDKVIATKKIEPSTMIDWKIPLGQLFSQYSQGTTMNLSIGQIGENDQVNKNPVISSPTLPVTDTALIRTSPITISKFELNKNNIARIYVMPFDKVKPFCNQKNSSTECTINVKSKTALQLPVLYYPEMLNVFLDRKPIHYDPTLLRYDATHYSLPFIGTTIIVPSGMHTISVNFNGINWANMTSVLAWLLLGAVLVSVLIRYIWFSITAKEYAMGIKS